MCVVFQVGIAVPSSETAETVDLHPDVPVFTFDSCH